MASVRLNRINETVQKIIFVDVLIFAYLPCLRHIHGKKTPHPIIHVVGFITLSIPYHSSVIFGIISILNPSAVIFQSHLTPKGIVFVPDFFPICKSHYRWFPTSVLIGICGSSTTSIRFLNQAPFPVVMVHLLDYSSIMRHFLIRLNQVVILIVSILYPPAGIIFFLF